MVKVSIIMPVYNASKFLAKSCESVFQQSLKDLELICVDDGSTDNSKEVLDDLSNKYDFIKIYSQDNQGSGKARNFGISKATGEYIAFLDADDIFLDNDALEKMYFYGSKNNAEMVGANLKRVNQNFQIERNYDFKNTKFKYYHKKDIILPVEYGIPFAFYKNIYNRDFLSKYNIEFPDLLRGQDPIFLANILTKIDQIFVLSSDLYGYNHSVSGGVNIKVNSYEKKYDYISHFKMTFDILKDNDFYTPFEAYKREFIDYIIFADNLHDSDIKTAFLKVFPNIDDYFNVDDYGYSYLDFLRKDDDDIPLEVSNFSDIKKCLIHETLINDNFIDVDYLRNYTSLLENNKENFNVLERLSFNAIKTVENEVNEDYGFLSQEENSLKNEINQYKSTNEKILSSNSWKFTKFLRTAKNFYK